MKEFTFTGTFSPVNTDALVQPFHARHKFRIVYGSWRFLWLWNFWDTAHEFTAGQSYTQTEMDDGLISVGVDLGDIRDLVIVRAPLWMRAINAVIGKPCGAILRVWRRVFPDDRAEE